MELHVRTRLPQVGSVMKRLGVDEHGDVQRTVTKEVFSRLKKYMPRRSGELAESKTRIEGDTLVKVDGPYARAQFFGITSEGKPFDYNLSANANAGPHWDRRMAAAEGGAIAAAAERAAGRM